MLYQLTMYSLSGLDRENVAIIYPAQVKRSPRTFPAPIAFFSCRMSLVVAESIGAGSVRSIMTSMHFFILQIFTDSSGPLWEQEVGGSNPPAIPKGLRFFH